MYNIFTNKQLEDIDMAKYVCDACGWEYDEELGSPENGIAPGTFSGKLVVTPQPFTTFMSPRFTSGPVLDSM